MAIQLGSAYGKVSLDSSGVKKGVSDGISNLNKLADVGQKIGKAMQKIGAGLTLGVTLPVVAFFKASIDSAVDAESKLAELNAVIKSTGGAAGLTSEQVTKMAAELEKVTKFADDDIIAGQSMLLTFTKIGKDVFPQATEAMLNMAEKFGGIDQAAIQLGKALNDPVAGVGALRRVGVSLSAQQEQQIKDFMAVNDIASAQKIILGELETEFGGLARAAGETTAGKFAQLNHAFDHLKETVGNQLIPILVPFIQKLTDLINKFSELTPAQQKWVIGLLALAALVGPITGFIGTIVSAISGIAGFIGGLSGLGVSLAGIGTALGGVGATIGAAVLPAIAAVGAALLPILAIIASLILIAVALHLAWKTNFLGIRDTVTMWVAVIKNLWKALRAFLHGDTDAMLKYLTAAFDAFGERFNQVFEKIFGIKDAWGKFLEWMRTTLGKVVSYISDVFTKTDWGKIGKFLVLSIANGLLLGIPTLLIQAAKMALSVIDTIKKNLGIHSPSKVFEQLGIFSAMGYQQGLTRAMSADGIANAMMRPVNQLASSQQQSVTMNFASGLSLTQVKGMIDQNNEQMMNTIIGSLGGE